MPELPEVETIARGLHKRVAGDTIQSIWLGDKPEPLKSSPRKSSEFSNTRGSWGCVASANTSSSTSNNRPSEEPAVRAHGQWIVHLGMTGRMQVTTPDVEIAKHTHAIAKLASGRELRFVDPRRFGRLAVVSECHRTHGLRSFRRRAA